MQVFDFDDLPEADLIVDAVYRGGTRGNAGDDPLARLVGGGNQGGFRYEGSPRERTVRFCILYSSLDDRDWPDTLDLERGLFIYYGDNKAPGQSLHETPRGGNVVLRDVFDDLHVGRRDRIPPFFIFTRSGTGRDVLFRGLAVPGALGVPQTEDLVAVWKSASGRRFQNYRSLFTILDTALVSRAWIDSLRAATDTSQGAPVQWKKWAERGIYEVLRSVPTKSYRSREEQLPSTPLDQQLVQSIIDYFKGHPDGEYAFEPCAAELLRSHDTRFVDFTMTRPRRDGGRDATGEYSIGLSGNSIRISFAMEAKCKGMTNGSGVGDVARLISRLKHREFGVFVTTSFVGEQACSEIAEDGHPVLLVTGADIAAIQKKSGRGTVAAVNEWLSAQWPY